MGSLSLTHSLRRLNPAQLEFYRVNITYSLSYSFTLGIRPSTTTQLSLACHASYSTRTSQL